MIGIYCIQNKVNGKRYIGQSINLESRTSDIHRNRHLNASIEKYGIENFSVTIIEECTVDDLDARERYWIAHYGTTDNTRGYNKDSGGNPGKILTEEARHNLSVSHLGNSSRQGTHVSSETAKLLGEYLRSYQGTESHSKGCSKRMTAEWSDPELREKRVNSMRVPHTPEHNLHVSQSMRGNKNNLGKRNIYKILQDGTKVSKRIDLSEVDEYLQQGWLSGM